MNPRPDSPEKMSQEVSPDRREEHSRNIQLLDRWGKLNKGQLYNILAMDIDRAIAAADLRKFETIIFQRVREKSWGEPTRSKKGRDNRWPDPKRCRISISEVADETGHARQHLSTGKASLVRSKILIEHNDGLLSINKAVHQWIFPKTGRSRFDERELNSFAATWPKHQQQLSFEPSEDHQKGERIGVRPENATAFAGERRCVRPENATAFAGERRCVRPPIEERPRGIESLEENSRRGEETNPPPENSSLSQENGEKKNFLYDPDPEIERKQLAIARALTGTTEERVPDPNPEIERKQRAIDELLAARNGRAK